MRLPRDGRRVYRRYGNYLLLTSSLCVGSALAEGLLTVLDVYFGVETARPLALSWWAFAPDTPPLSAAFVTDGELGSRFNEPNDPSYNAQGFRDRDDFATVNEGTALRVLLLGDSFAYGAAAVYDGSDSGFADLLEQRLDRAVPGGAKIWNTGIPGISQREQRLHLKKYFPVMKPHIVLLTFYANDPDENMHPAGIYYVYTDKTWANRYVLTGDEVRKLTPEEAWLRAKGVPFDSASALLRLRTASLVYRLRHEAAEPLTANGNGLGITRALVREIAAYVSQHDAMLMVMLIPHANTMSHGTAAAPREASVIGMLREVADVFIDMRAYLTLADYTPPPDNHWTKQAHRKASEVLCEHILQKVVRREIGGDVPGGVESRRQQ